MDKLLAAINVKSALAGFESNPCLHLHKAVYLLQSEVWNHIFLNQLPVWDMAATSNNTEQWTADFLPPKIVNDNTLR